MNVMKGMAVSGMCLMATCRAGAADAPGDPVAVTEAGVYRTPSGESLNYRLYKPPQMKKGRRYPLILFLHGAGERGNNNTSQLVHGIRSIIAASQDQNQPCFIVAPQCPAQMQWVNTPWSDPSHTMLASPSVPMTLSLELLKRQMKELPVDPKRVYVTGVSMGGYGTWDAIQRHPELFAAAVPVCGGADTALAPGIKDVPVWVFHGAEDKAVPTSRARDMVEALKKAGGNPRYTEYPGVGHDSWTRAYADPELYRWLFAQKQKTSAGFFGRMLHR